MLMDAIEMFKSNLISKKQEKRKRKRKKFLFLVEIFVM